MSIGSKGLTEREAEEEEEAVVEKEGSGREAGGAEEIGAMEAGEGRVGRGERSEPAATATGDEVEDRREDPRGGRCETEAEGAAGEGIPRCEYCEC